MASRPAQKRLLKEYAAIRQQPPPFIIARPLERNLLEWHYVITGPPDSPYHQGEYHGKLVFPADYPFKPPSIMMITPSGRFKPGTRLCLTMSDFHPEQWNPSWSVASILTGLLSFMMEQTATTGSVEATDFVRRQLARDSRRWNREENSKFAEVFPDLMKEPVALVSVSQPLPFSKPQESQITPRLASPRQSLVNANKKSGGNSDAGALIDTNKQRPLKQPVTQQPANLLDSDLISTELGPFIQNRFFRGTLLVAVLSYLLYRWWLS